MIQNLHKTVKDLKSLFGKICYQYQKYIRRLYADFKSANGVGIKGLRPKNKLYLKI
jgi:hypothetical protein